MINKVQSAKCKVQRRGFTLIELLVVISVIGILAALILARFGTVEKSARDARRKSDLNQYRTALENYSIKTNGTYPSYTAAAGTQASTTLCTKLGTDYISACPEDPLYDATTNPNRYYRYLANGSPVQQGDNVATAYKLWGDLENGGYWVICSNGKTQDVADPGSVSCW